MTSESGEGHSAETSVGVVTLTVFEGVKETIAQVFRPLITSARIKMKTCFKEPETLGLRRGGAKGDASWR